MMSTNKESFQLSAASCLLLITLLQILQNAQVAHCFQLAAAPPPPAANFAQLARTPASSLLLNEFLMHEKQRTSLLQAPELGGASSPSVPRSIGSSPAQRTPQMNPLLPPDQPGSISSATPTYSQAISQFRLDQYHPIEEIYGYLQALARNYPKRANVFTIGHTGEGRPIKALELINNSTDPDYVWLDALTHAREWITGTTILYTIDRLMTGGGGGGNQNQIYNKNFVIVPVVNPDGYAYTWSTNRMWRKNRSKAAAAATAGSANSLTGRPQQGDGVVGSKSCIGADLNRNFDHSFAGEGSSSDPCSHIYSGAFPFSEPETRALADLMWSLKDRIKFYLTMHSFNQLWACPYAHTTEQSAHIAQHMRVLRVIQQAVYQAEGVHYEIGPLSTSLYVGSGFGIDFAYDKCGIVNSYLVELRDRGANGFILPADQIMPTARETFAGLKAGLRMIFSS